jgi:hypothetical protein
MDSEFERKVEPFDPLAFQSVLYPTGRLAWDWAATHFGGN